jgi:hypothetical protein
MATIQESRSTMYWNMNTSIHRRPALRYGYLVLMLVLLARCGATPGHLGYLRGDVLLYLRLPLQNGRQESIEYGKQHFVGRSFDPVTVGSPVNHVAIPDSLWTELEQLRHDWCNHPPIGAVPTPSETDFVIVFQCDHVANPVNVVRATDMPPALRALIDLVPSTDERLIVP